MKRNRILVVASAVVVLTAAIVIISRVGRQNLPAVQESAVSATEYYTCPMHPSVRSDHPGACPICGMTLVKKSVVSDTALVQEHGSGEVTISPAQQVLANVATTVVERMRLTKVIRAVGTVAAAEPNVRRISARFPGRIERLYLTYTGQTVHKGDPVADVYSPEAISAQEEFLLALQSSDSMEGNGRNDNLLAQSREKLIRWGFTEGQMSELRRSRKVGELVTIHSPINGTVITKKVDPQHYAAAGEDLFEVADLSTVWLNADVYEFDLRSLNMGESVEATTDAYPGRKFRGRIAFISPSVDPETRTVRVRAEIQNPTGELKTDMYMNVVIKVQLPESVVVPLSAVVSTGSHRVVWVRKSEGVFEPRMVEIGERTDEYYQILDGIAAGEIIVTSGGYLVDSESQLQLPAGTGHTHSQ